MQCAHFDTTGELLLTGGDDGLILIHRSEFLLGEARRAAEREYAMAAARDVESRGSRGHHDTMDGGEQDISGDSIDDPTADRADLTRDAGPIDSAGRITRTPTTVEPILALEVPLSKLYNAKWNPSDQNTVGIAGSGARHVCIYDLAHTQGSPREMLTMPSQGSGGLAASDLEFFTASSHGYALLAGGMSGNIFLWDVRAGNRSPAATLHSLHGGGVTSLQLVDNDYVVLAGTQFGEIRGWDLRRGGGTAVTFGGVPHRHPSLMCIGIRNALADVPGLALQAGGIPHCSIQSFVLDPRDHTRAGFHLGCGWSGVVDMASGRITHVHAPSRTLLTDEQPTAEDGVEALVLWSSTAYPNVRRRAAWTADSSRFVVPSRQEDALLLLDFDASSTCSGGAATMMGEGSYQEIMVGEHSAFDTAIHDPMRTVYHVRGYDAVGEEMGWRPPSAVTVSLSQGPICVAAMPDTTALVAGGSHSYMSVVDMKF